MATATLDDFASLADGIADLADADGSPQIDFWAYAAVTSCLLARLDGGFDATKLSDASIRIGSAMFGKLMDRVGTKAGDISPAQREAGLEHFDDLLRTALTVHGQLAPHYDCDVGQTYGALKASDLAAMIEDENDLLRCAIASDAALCKLIWGKEPGGKYAIIRT